MKAKVFLKFFIEIYWKYAKNVSLKGTEEFCLISLKSDAKFEEKPTFCFKIFYLDSKLSRTLTFIGRFCEK